MSRIDVLKSLVDTKYQAKNSNRADWADWLHEHHVFVVAERAHVLALRFGAQEELSVAAAMLHDIADAVTNRFDPAHDVLSAEIARKLLREAGFHDEELAVIVDDAMRYHSCNDGEVPQTLEGKVMATADAVAHLDSDFYPSTMAFMAEQKSLAAAQDWARAKIERDFKAKILFPDVRAEMEPVYRGLLEMLGEHLP